MSVVTVSFWNGFNEAAGIHRRKRAGARGRNRGRAWGFNEAAGIHRRKHPYGGTQPVTPARASMRPPEFTGGNPRWSRPCRAPASALQ